MEKQDREERHPGEAGAPGGEKEKEVTRLRKSTVVLLALFLFALLSAAGGAFLNVPYLTPLSMVLMVILLFLLSRGPGPSEPGGKAPPEGPSRSAG